MTHGYPNLTAVRLEGGGVQHRQPDGHRKLSVGHRHPGSRPLGVTVRTSNANSFENGLSVFQTLRTHHFTCQSGRQVTDLGVGSGWELPVRFGGTRQVWGGGGSRPLEPDGRQVGVPVSHD